MSYHLDDTIAAIATAPGGAARGIVRLSGREVVACLAACFQANDAAALGGLRSATVLPGVLQLEGGHVRLPADLYLWPDARSYTREPVAELHAIGSPPLLEAALQTLCALGARVAEPGEFTLRAFLAGRLDLTQAEAVLGVIDARHRDQLDVALGQLAGNLARPLTELRERLLNLLAELEAGLDFAEEDIEFISRQELDRQLARAERTIRNAGRRMDARQRSDSEARIVLAGWPNVGKSSLLNALVGRADALVSAQAGTTRDYLTARLGPNGGGCQLIDTAGVEPNETGDELHQAAQQMTAGQRQQADVELLCLDHTRTLNDWERRQLARPPRGERIVVLTKTDLPAAAVSNADDVKNLSQFRRGTGVSPVIHGRDARATSDVAGFGIGSQVRAIATSSVRGTGLDELRAAIATAITARDTQTDVVAGTAARCRESLRQSAACLARARRLVAGGGEELIAAELRSALNHVGTVVGAVYSDDVLDRIFSRFCIGK